MAYLPLRNYKYDSGIHRIQSGPNHEGFTISSSGVMDTGADNGIVVAGTPNFFGAYDSSWRTFPYTASGTIFDVGSTAYQPSGALSSYTAYRTLTRTSVANSSVSDSIGADYGLITNGIYTNLGGVSPSSQVYSPYNTPAANTAAEGYTGGGVTHRSYENGLLVNTLGSQGTSDRSQWRYSQPVYCKTYTETVRPDSPGLMSTAVRYVYRGESTRYSLNTGAVMAYASPQVEPDASLSFTTGEPVIYTPWQAPYVSDAVSYSWFSNGYSILGANKSTYIPTFDQLGSRLYVNVTDSRGKVVTSKSYKSLIGYKYYLSSPVVNASINIYRKVSGFVGNCPGPVPEPDFNPQVTNLNLVTSSAWDSLLVSVGEGSPINNYTYELYASCPFGTYTNLTVYVYSYLGGVLVSSNTFDYLVDAPFKQASFKIYCALTRVINTDNGETVNYSRVDLV